MTRFAMRSRAWMAPLLLALCGVASAQVAGRNDAAPAAGLVVGEVTAAALYNTANGYARANKTGLAVLYYERARLLDPTDADIDANLGVVRRAATLPPPAPEWYDGVARLAAPSVFAYIGVAGLFVCGASVLLLRRSQARRGLLRLGALVGLAAVAAPALQALSTWPLVHSGIVITHAAEARVSPVSLGDPAFTIPEGERVRIASRHQGYVLVRTRAGRSGWLAAESVVPIVP